jgi:hypothetical protein
MALIYLIKTESTWTNVYHKAVFMSAITDFVMFNKTLQICYIKFMKKIGDLAI